MENESSKFPRYPYATKIHRLHNGGLSLADWSHIHAHILPDNFLHDHYTLYKDVPRVQKLHVKTQN